MLWEQAYREQATITNAEKWVKQEKQHRTIVSLQVQEGRVVRLTQRQRGPKAGLKMPRRINLHRYEAIQAAVDGQQGCVAIDEFDLEPAERHKELVRKQAKLYFEEQPGLPAMTGVLVNVSYNAGHKRVCGYYYDSAERDRMPMLGGLVDLKQCIVCTTDDIGECHAAYKANMRRERESGERTGDQLEPWEHREMREEKAADKLVDKVIRGRITFEKYKNGVAQLADECFLYDDDYDTVVFI